MLGSLHSVRWKFSLGELNLSYFCMLEQLFPTGLMYNLVKRICHAIQVLKSTSVCVCINAVCIIFFLTNVWLWGSKYAAWITLKEQQQQKKASEMYAASPTLKGKERKAQTIPIPSSTHYTHTIKHTQYPYRQAHIIPIPSSTHYTHTIKRTLYPYHQAYIIPIPSMSHMPHYPVQTLCSDVSPLPPF